MQKDMTEGKPFALMLAFCFPLIISNLYQQICLIVNSVIVGQFLGESGIAAMGATTPLNNLIHGFVVGLCYGFTVPFAQHYGAKDMTGMRRSIAGCLRITLVLGGIMTVLTVLFNRKMLMLIRTPDNILKDANLYSITIFAGTYIVFLYNIVFGLLRAVGDSKTPLLLSFGGSTLNVVMNYVLIRYLHMGLIASAISALANYGLFIIAGLILIVKKHPECVIRKEEWTRDMARIQELLRVGVPMGLQYMITAVGTTVLQSSINAMGPTVIAATSVASSVYSFVTQPLEMLGLTVVTYVSQNYGVRNMRRIREGVRQGLLIGAIFSLYAFLMLWLLGKPLSSLYVRAAGQELLDLAHQFMMTCGYLIAFLDILMILRYTVQGVGYAALAMVCGVMEMFARSFAGLVLVRNFGYTGVRLSNPIAWFAADLFLVPAYFVVMKHIENRRSIEP